MTLNEADLDILVAECKRLMADSEYKSPSFYAIISKMIQQLIRIYRYQRYPVDLKEQLELDAIIRCYRKIPRFNLERATIARAKHGYLPNEPRSFHSFVQLIIVSSFYTTLASHKKKQAVYVPLDFFGITSSTVMVDLDNQYTMQTDNPIKSDSAYEISMLLHDDIDALIDSQRQCERQCERKDK